MNPKYLPFSKGDYCDMVKKLGLPPLLIYVRMHAAACGYFGLYLTSDNSGNPVKIGMIHYACDKDTYLTNF
jgi:hypothetical protein